MELLDVYDIDRKKTGRTIGRGAELLPGEYLTVVHLCVFNGENMLLIQRRAYTKDRYPGVWDLSAGGFAKSGESSLNAALREAKEELGISCRREELRFALTEPFGCVFDDIYILRRGQRTEDYSFQREEVSELRFEAPEAILAMLESGEFVDYPPDMMKRLFAML